MSSSKNNNNEPNEQLPQEATSQVDQGVKKETSSSSVRPSYNSQGSQQQVASQLPQPPKRTAFVHKLYAMLSDPTLSHLIWWSRNDEEGVFALHPGTEFANALTNYFKHGNVSSFVRQLHMYGFHKVFDNDNENAENKESGSNNNSNSDDLIWEFRHSTGNFKKGDEASLAYIKRRSSNKLVPEDDLKNNRLTDSNVFYPRHHYPLPPEYIPNQPQPPQQQQQQQLHQPQAQHLQSQPDPHHSDQYYIMQQQQYSAGSEVQRSQSPSSYSTGYQQIPRNHQYQYQQQQQRSSFGSPFTQERHFTPPPPMNQQQIQPQQAPAPGSEVDGSHVHQVTSDLMDQQRSMSVKSEYLNNELRSTSSDVLRFSENIPKLAPVLQQQGHRYSEGFNNLRQSFNLRADYYKPSPLSVELDPHHPQQFPATAAGATPGSSLPPPHPSAIPQHIQNLQHHQGIQLRNQSIHFWESSGQRQPSVFVDPLNPSPQGSVSSSSSSGNRSHAPQHQQPQGLVVPPSNPVYHISPSMKGSSSVPHIHFQPNQSITRRNESLPSNLPTSSPSSTTSPQFPTRSPLHHGPPPRSIPINNSGDRGSSIPNISHLTSQLRPSVIEVHQNQQVNHPTSAPNTQNTSVSSNSTYNTMYSANSSISSISSRNSYGSISATFQELSTSSSPPPSLQQQQAQAQAQSQPLHYLHHPHHPHPHHIHHPHHINRQSLQRTPSSPSRIKEIIEDGTTASNPKSKLSVSSLLTTSLGDTAEEEADGTITPTSGKRESESHAEDVEKRSIKRAKSVNDFHK